MPEKFDSQKKIILFASVVFVLASGWLFWTSDRYLNSDTHQNWWTVYFVEPKTNSLDFVIENHGDKDDFHWEILIDKKKQSEGDENISRGEAQKIEIPVLEASDKKISVQVSTSGERQEVYKNLTK